jgi:uncharacterized membrane protein
MKKYLFIVGIVLLQSCASPKYSYYFDHHTYQTVKSITPQVNTEPLSIDPHELVASTETAPAVTPATTPSEKTAGTAVSPEVKKKLDAKTFREIKKKVKTTLAAAKKNAKAAASSGRMDNDLKLAAIFGAVGIVALLIGTQAFNIIGGIALLIGVVFFVKWLLRQ